MNKTTYIELLPDATRQAVYTDLLQLGIPLEDVDSAMNSRLCDLENTLDIEKYIN